MGPSGGLTDVAEHGISYELAEVRRFTNTWEGPASLRLRDGDTSVPAEYAKHGRIVDAGSVEQAEQGAARAWLADALKGRESLVITVSNEAAARVSTQLRAELVSLGRVQETGVPLGLQGTTAGVGDLIQARHPDRARGLVNRALFRVTDVRSDGGLGVVLVTHTKDHVEVAGTPREIPADYVRDHVALGYASTEAAAIGRTVYGGYPVLTPGMDAATTYVASTRGAETNVAFVVTQAAPVDSASGETAKAARRSAEAVFAEVIGRRDIDVDLTRTATTQLEQSQELARAAAAHVDPLTSVIGDVTAGRAARTLDQLAVRGLLPAEHRLELAADEAMGTLEQLLRRAELAGHDPEAVLIDAVTSRGLYHADFPARVLHARIRTTLAEQLAPNLDSYADLIPSSAPAPVRPQLEAWAAAADARRHELGAQTAEQSPQWAREALGPVPEDLLERAGWEQKAGWAASYREWAGHTDDADPLGNPPPAGLAEKHAVWETAHNALGLIDVTSDEEEMTDGQLRNRVSAYERELNWAPRYVADELEATHNALRGQQTDATVWTARAESADPSDREQLGTAAAEARQLAEVLIEQVEQLEQADHIRGAWYAATATTREYAMRARATLESRGVDLDAPDDRVTSEEWLAAERAEQAETDPHRTIRDENDLYDTAETAPVDDDLLKVDQVELETALPDIRDTSAPDEAERADPGERRRVPRVDETAATVDRAEAALTELNTREHSDATNKAHADTQEPEESLRAAELNRWAESDQGAEKTLTDDSTMSHAQ
jgi:hypothetical protein